MSKFKVGDAVEILRVARSNAPLDLIGKKGKVLTAYDGSGLTHPYCILDIAPGGIYNVDLKLADKDWDE